MSSTLLVPIWGLFSLTFLNRSRVRALGGLRLMSSILMISSRGTSSCSKWSMRRWGRRPSGTSWGTSQRATILTSLWTMKRPNTSSPSRIKTFTQKHNMDKQGNHSKAQYSASTCLLSQRKKWDRLAEVHPKSMRKLRKVQKCCRSCRMLKASIDHRVSRR